MEINLLNPPPPMSPVVQTSISSRTVLKAVDRSLQVPSSSMAASKFPTYSEYILRKGAWRRRTSPRAGRSRLRDGRDYFEVPGRTTYDKCVVHRTHDSEISGLHHHR